MRRVCPYGVSSDNAFLPGECSPGRKASFHRFVFNATATPETAEEAAGDVGGTGRDQVGVGIDADHAQRAVVVGREAAVGAGDDHVRIGHGGGSLDLGLVRALADAGRLKAFEREVDGPYEPPDPHREGMALTDQQEAAAADLRTLLNLLTPI